MSGKYCAFVCSVILLLISSSKSQQNYTRNEEKDDNFTIPYEIYTDSTTSNNDEIKIMQHDQYKKFINNTQNNKMQYEFNTKSNRKDNDLIQHKLDEHLMQNHKKHKQISMKSHTTHNSTNVNDKINFMSQADENLIERNDSMPLEILKNSSKDYIDNNNTNIVPIEKCYNDTCIRLCCPLGDRLDEDICIPEGIEYIFSKVYTSDSMRSENKTDDVFQLAIYDSCQGKDHMMLPEGLQYDYMIFANGSIYLSHYKIFVKSASYCLAIVEGDKFEVIFCSETYDEIEKLIDNDETTFLDVQIIFVSFHVVSIIFLLMTFLVYSILPELRNIHGFMLRNYSAALSIAYGVDIVNILIKTRHIEYPVCVTIAFFNYFCFLAGFFWLIMISFDMWCTFRGFCSLHRNVKRREQRKLVYYTIFAWGCPFIFAVFCVIMDSISEHIPEILQPGFRTGDCWFHGKGPFVLYYYGIKSVCIISSICLSISTALKIARYEKDTGLRLTDSESKRYNDNKKWFSLYLKLFVVLFIVMGVKWSVMTASWLVGNISNYVSFVINVVDIMQNLCTFIIFVCKKKIKVLLLKRFGCGLFPQVRSDTNVTSSTTTSEVPMQEKISSCAQESYPKSLPNGTEL